MYGQLYTKITVRTFKIHTSCAFLLFVHIPFLGFILIFAGFLGCRGWRGLIWEWGWFRGGRRVNFAMFFFPLNISSTLSSFSVLHEGHLLYWKTVTASSYLGLQEAPIVSSFADKADKEYKPNHIYMPFNFFHIWNTTTTDRPQTTVRCSILCQDML